jgi:hypothetical protein
MSDMTSSSAAANPQDPATVQFRSATQGLMEGKALRAKEARAIIEALGTGADANMLVPKRQFDKFPPGTRVIDVLLAMGHIEKQPFAKDLIEAFFTHGVDGATITGRALHDHLRGAITGAALIGAGAGVNAMTFELLFDQPAGEYLTSIWNALRARPDFPAIVTEHGKDWWVSATLKTQGSHSGPRIYQGRERLAFWADAFSDIGLDPNTPDKNGRLAVYFAEDLDVLVDHGARTDVIDQHGQTPLHTALANRNFNAAKILLGMGADPNAPDHHGNTPLHCFFLQDEDDLYDYGVDFDEETFVLLLEHGGHVEATNNDGTPTWDDNEDRRLLIEERRIAIDRDRLEQNLAQAPVRKSTVRL